MNINFRPKSTTLTYDENQRQLLTKTKSMVNLTALKIKVLSHFGT